MAEIQVSLINRSTVLTDAQVESVIPDLQTQVRRDFLPVWGVDADLTFVGANGTPHALTWWLTILDNSDAADALGYHDLTPDGLPAGKVFAGSDIRDGQSWTVTASHELLEMLGDPDVNLTAFVQSSETAGTLYAYEVCDACEGDQFGYAIGATIVSDFVFPSWFESFRTEGSTQFDFQKRITAPFQLLAAGYIGIYDIASGSGWHQIQKQGAPYLPSMRARLGSRRERRRTLRGHWIRSAPRTGTTGNSVLSTAQAAHLTTDSAPVAAGIGERKASEVFARRVQARGRRAEALAARRNRLSAKALLTAQIVVPPAASRETAGFLVAVGDSWFDYPIHDVLTELEDKHGYNVESAAHHGDAIEAMAYRDGQLDKFARCMDKVKAHGSVPRAILLSGGGNDIAGAEFGMLLNNATSPIAGWNVEIVDAVINQRIGGAYRAMLDAIISYCQKDLGKVLPILVHGYDYPVPDGRGFLGGWGPLPGPWLKPGFTEKLFTDLQKNTPMMHDLIDQFNKMLITVTMLPEYQRAVFFIDLRNTLSSDPASEGYKDWWGNELHPKEKGFATVADRFAVVLDGLQ